MTLLSTLTRKEAGSCQGRVSPCSRDAAVAKGRAKLAPSKSPSHGPSFTPSLPRGGRSPRFEAAHVCSASAAKTRLRKGSGASAEDVLLHGVHATYTSRQWR